MKNTTLTQTIQELSEQTKDLPDTTFYVDASSCHYLKVTTKTPELALAYAKAFENCYYDTYGGETGSDEDTWGWWNYKDALTVVDSGKLEKHVNIYDLDNYDFKYCEKPKIVTT